MGFLKKLFGGSEPKDKSNKVADAGTNEPPRRGTMHTLAPGLVVEPFGKINYWDLPNGGKRVRVYFVVENQIEGAQTGVAIDGSGSMQINFGKEALRMTGRQLTQQHWQVMLQQGLARRRGNQVEIVDFNSPQTLTALVNFGVMEMVPAGENIVESQSRIMTEYLTKFDEDGGTTVIYWATGDGRQIEVIGDFTRDECSSIPFAGPNHFGNETHLLPAIKYFVERFADARWGIYVFITDGALNDLDAVKRYCIQLARNIKNRKQNDLKFVLIGVGDDIDPSQMEELDDLETGTDIDLWDHKIAKEMKNLADIFTEVVNESVIIVPGDGIVKDSNDTVVKDFRDTGLPALMWFDLPPNSQWFSLEIGGQTITQPMAAGVQLPVSQPAPSPTTTAEMISCFECQEPLPAGTKVCTRCGTSQDGPLRPSSTQPATVPTPTAPPSTASPTLIANPASLDFGSVSRWTGDLPSQEVRLQNSGDQTWQGTVSSTLPWLDVNPKTVTCASGDEFVLTVVLTSSGKRLKSRIYNVEDAIIVEGEGQTMQIRAKVDTR